MDSSVDKPQEQQNQPIFNIPGVVLALLVAMVGIHVIRETFLSQELNIQLLVQTAFVPQRYSLGLAGEYFPYLVGPISYSFLHGDYTHLLINSFWLTAFGSVVARRWGVVRFALFWISASVASALFFLMFNWGALTFMIGASGVISALMGAATRFAFPKGGRFTRDKAHFLPRQSFVDVFQNKTVVIYLAIWFAINLVPLLAGSVSPQLNTVAWEAHIGGFLFGFLFFGVFDHKNWQ